MPIIDSPAVYVRAQDPVLLAARDEIDRLTAEVERLRGWKADALVVMADVFAEFATPPVPPEPEEGEGP